MRYRLLSALVAAATVAAVETATETYEYIVVGSGPGGGPLACDLARAGYKTLLIEAGGDEGDNPTYSELGNFLEAANDEATRWYLPLDPDPLCLCQAANTMSHTGTFGSSTRTTRHGSSSSST